MSLIRQGILKDLISFSEDEKSITYIHQTEPLWIENP